jgi:hypothetical protein
MSSSLSFLLLLLKQELSNSVWALATAGIIPTNLDYFDTTFNDNINKNVFLNDDPVTLCFGAAADELIKRPSEFKEQEIKDILWSFSKVSTMLHNQKVRVCVCFVLSLPHILFCFEGWHATSETFS